MNTQRSGQSFVRIWLWIVAAMIFAMVIVGGATRLTDSGLSITEWKPLLGAIPPLNHEDWLVAFAKYQTIPEYQTINQGMKLEDFKFIYWWEWGHRFLGRIIGMVFIVPLLFFAYAKQLPRQLWGRLFILFVLGGLQGALGWYMVTSGLSERIDVSQYRLAAHLSLAFALFAAVVWTAFGLENRRVWAHTNANWLALIILLVLGLQVAAGAFVAGLDAGLASDTWPLMHGELVPSGMRELQPLWLNWFENALAVQFNHRMLAYVLFALIVLQAIIAPSLSTYWLLVGAVVQMTLGILTVLWQVPLSTALTHQGGALILVALALWHLNLQLKPRLVPNQQ